MSYRCENCNDIDFTTLCSAIWLDGPLKFDDNCDNDDSYDKEYKRKSNEKVTLKCLDNSQNNINEFLNEIETGFINNVFCNMKIYGISQNPSTKDYVIVLEDCYCEKCGSRYTYSDFRNKWSPNVKVALKCLYNSQNITNEFLNELGAYSFDINNSILKVYGISQNPVTKDYIMVL
ncbi:kinase-like domain-containing protein [Rhizophagus clarus]|uniref:Kinase-like domain-containing protein n=1 Tax=Rhizophagus clarus TaxID=94130 RepID=A0A8H3L9T0_9GLOM|nr:kinase-like domain-containing protein [Rhizophagus clarus]